MNIDKPLQQQIALVTGASRGIGQAIALELARLGATVIGTATSAAGAEAISGTLSAFPPSVGKVLDVCSNEQIDAVLDDIATNIGKISILVNNAGITRDNLSIRMKDQEWDEVINTNLRAIYKLSQAVMRNMMKARYGRIINITSIVGHSGNPGQVNYCAAKAGVGGLTRSLARELGSRNITVNCVAPGLIDTDMTRNLEHNQREALLANIPLNRLGKPADIAAAVAFLAGSQASYITGTTIHVNGGMFMD